MAAPESWDDEADVVVIGAGCGGMSAGLAASLLGLSVIVCEKTEQVGGTTATSAGTIWIPLTTGALQGANVDSPENVDRYLAALIPGAARSRQLRAFLDAGPRMLEFFARHTETVRFTLVARHPDYRFDQPGAVTAGRALIPPMFDGRLLGADFDRIRAPIREFMPLRGMMVGKDDIAPLVQPFASVAHLRHATGLLWRYAADRLKHRRGTRLVMGNALVARLFAALRAQKVPIRYGHALVELLRGPDRVMGVVVDTGNGRRRIHARRGVVLAAGGFGGSAALRARYLPKPQAAPTAGFEGNTADALEAATRAGADMDTDHVTPTFWVPVSLMRRDDGTEARFPHILLDRAKPGLIAVDARGRRFTNEADSYHDFVLAMYANHARAGTVPAWLVCDAKFVHDYGLGLVYPRTANLRLQRYVDRGYLKRADTLEALAEMIGVDRGGLAATVARYNEHSARGEDPDFGKGSTVLNRHNGDPAQEPNPCLRPLGAGPYFAVAVYPSDLSTSVGLRADEHARVLDASGAPITGLYACGADMSSVMKGAYPGPGTTLGPAMTFGYLAAQHLATPGGPADPDAHRAVEAMQA